MWDILGFNLENLDAQYKQKLDGILSLILEIRDAARKDKNWELSDKIRDRLIQNHIEVRGTPDGSKWTLKE